MQNSPKTLKFDHEVLSSDANGRTVKTDSYPFKIYEALGTGLIYYSTQDAKFWLNEGSECPEEVFTKQFLPSFRWKFDEFVEQEKYKVLEVETTDEKGRTKIEKQNTLMGKEVVNKFPCTTKNILKKRAELLAIAAQTGQVDIKAIQRETSPTHLLSSAEVQAAVAPVGLFGGSYGNVKRLMRS